MKSNIVLKIKIIIFILITCVTFSLFYLPNDSRITFSYTTHDRGIMFQHDDGVFRFPFQNTGTQPLIISMVKSSCGCLVPYYNYEPVKPGAWDTIYGKYDMSRLGPISKSLTVTCNDSLQQCIVLRIKGNVIAKPLHLKLFDLVDSAEIKFNDYNVSEINLMGRNEVTIEIKNSLDVDRKISWRVKDNLKIESDRPIITNTEYEATLWANTILPACESIMIKITNIKTDEYSSSEFRFEIDDSSLQISFKQNREK